MGGMESVFASTGILDLKCLANLICQRGYTIDGQFS
jgi:hypothetical protein